MASGLTRRTAAGLVAGFAAAGLTGQAPPARSRFAEAGVTGTFALARGPNGSVVTVEPERAARRYVPASTFKIANALIALETAVVKDVDEVIPYGGQPQPVKAWEADASIRQAMPISAVPIFQELARRIGLTRYAQWLARLDYGNRETGAVVDRFWLDGPLAISAVEQARFLHRLGTDALPVSTRSREMVRDVLRVEASGGAILFGKTGWAQKIGWFAGWVERGPDTSSFALNIDMPRIDMAPLRLDIAKALLKDYGVY